MTVDWDALVAFYPWPLEQGPGKWAKLDLIVASRCIGCQRWVDIVQFYYSFSWGSSPTTV